MGSVSHGVAEDGVRIRDIAEVIGRHLDVPVTSVAPGAGAEHFGFLGLDARVSSDLTRELVGWSPVHPGLFADLDRRHYFHTPAPTA